MSSSETAEDAIKDEFKRLSDDFYDLSVHIKEPLQKISKEIRNQNEVINEKVYIFKSSITLIDI